MSFLTAKDFVAAMARNPEDCVLPLVYADWLEDDGQTERARWVRLGQAVREAAAAGVNDGLLVGRRRKLWKRLRPADRGVLYGPDQRDPAAYACVDLAVSIGHRRPLRTEDWPRRAFEAGWLGEVTCRWGGSVPGELADELVGSLAGVPLRLDLTLSPTFGPDGWFDGQLAGIAALAPLARLGLRFPEVEPTPRNGRPPRPTDADLLQLAPLANLHHLTLENCPGVTEAGIAALKAAIPGLVVRRADAAAG